MLHFEVDPRRGVPTYRQIMDQVKYYAASGALRSGDRLPSIRELARYLRVNPATVVKAYSELGHEQLIEQRHGKGAFVTDGAGVSSAADRRAVLGTLSRHLVVEARQMGAPDQEVIDAVRQELRTVRADFGRSREAGATP